jgi:cobaltochelatase CobN
LLDEYATVAALDPDKLPAIRAQIWSLIEAAHLHQDLGVDAQPGSAEFDNFVLHIDGYLCEIKDAAIRDGLHILGAAPSGEALVNLVLVILRAPQLWSARWGALPGLRDALTLPEALTEALTPTPPTPSTPPTPFTPSAPSIPSVRVETDRSERVARELVEAMAAADWDVARASEVASRILVPSSVSATPVLSAVSGAITPEIADKAPHLRVP